MLDTFKARLKAKSTAAGANLSQKRIDDISDRLHKKYPELTDEAAHDTEIDDWYPVSELKQIASFDDYERTKAARAAKKKEPETEKDPETKTDDEMPAWAKTLIDQNKSLADRLQSFEQEKTQGTIKQQLKEKLPDVPAKFYENWQLPDKADNLDEFVQKVNTEYTGLRTEMGFTGSVGIPASGSPPSNVNKLVSPAIKQFAEKEKMKAQQQQVQKT